MSVEKCSLSLWYGILPGSFRFWGMVTSNLGDVSAQELWQVGIDISFPCTNESTVTHLISTQPNMQRSSRRVQADRSLCVVCGSFLQCWEYPWISLVSQLYVYLQPNSWLDMILRAHWQHLRLEKVQELLLATLLPSQLFKLQVLEEDSRQLQIWLQKKSLERTNQVPGGKMFCTAWKWRMTPDTKRAS